MRLKTFVDRKPWEKNFRDLKIMVRNSKLKMSVTRIKERSVIFSITGFVNVDYDCDIEVFLNPDIEPFSDRWLCIINTAVGINSELFYHRISEYKFTAKTDRYIVCRKHTETA